MLSFPRADQQEMRCQRKSSGEKPYTVLKANEMVPGNLRIVKDAYIVPGRISLLGLCPGKNLPTHAEEAALQRCSSQRL